MRKLVLILVIAISLSGCTYVQKIWPWSKSPEKQEVKVRKKKLRSTNTIIINKRTAIQLAQQFLQENDFEDVFVLRKASKLKRRLLMSSDPIWVWEVYFPAKKENKWKFWRRSPIMVAINTETGSVEHWGRR